MKCLVFFCVVFTLFTSEVFARGRSSWHKNNLLKNIFTEASELKIYVEGDFVITFPEAKTEYVFLKDKNGKVIIIDAKTYEEVTTYNLPEISNSLVAIVNDAFYNIDTVSGTIMSTAVENIVNGPDAVYWTHVSSFPSETSAMDHGVAVNNTSIYFVTYYGVLYLFDTMSNTVTKMGTTLNWDSYASLVIVDGILYIHKYSYFYSFAGATVKVITTPETRLNPALFQFGSLICRVGGNSTNIGLNPDPVSCYNPSDETWNVTSYINQYRQQPGISSTESGTFIFGGYAFHVLGPNNWLNSVEVFSPKTKIWSYAKSPLVNEPKWVQAVTFYF